MTHATSPTWDAGMHRYTAVQGVLAVHALADCGNRVVTLLVMLLFKPLPAVALSRAESDTAMNAHADDGVAPAMTALAPSVSMETTLERGD